jgi:16S rRNA (adenine1518-N6/adenine1519-N6)-dimethyltransferase
MGSFTEKSLGQHFLKNKSAIEKIIRSLALKRGERVIEIGAGHGELTSELLKKTEVIAIEKDRLLANGLQQMADGHLEIVQGDALQILPSLSDKLPAASYKLVGNIPYYITGHLLRIISELQNKPSLCLLTMQREVAERIIAQPPRMNRLSAITQFWAEPKIILKLKPGDFYPPPEINSAVIQLKTRESLPKNERDYYKLARILFQQPRKTVLNNLESGLNFGKKNISEILRKMGLNEKTRPQNLSVAQIEQLSTALA